LGDTRTTLFVSSPIGGEYTCPLFGHCTAPRPQGPIIIKTNGPSTASITFKNVYPNPANFTFTIDNPSFTVKPLENIPGKKAIVVTVTYKQVNAKSPKTAKMIVTCLGSVSWTYYLKAV
jgi:hydrocephalus-inducing protein